MYSSSQQERPTSPYVLNKIFSFDKTGPRVNSDLMHQHISELNCLNEKELIIRLIKETNFNKNYFETNYSIKSARIVKNINLEQEYINKRREMKANRSHLQERFTYFIIENQLELNEILSNGFTKSSFDLDKLGNSLHGVHLAKHLDIELEYHLEKKIPKFSCLMVKTLIGKTCLIQPSNNNKHVNPNYLADCHLAKEITSQTQDLDTKRSNSLIYVYDINKKGCLNTQIRNAIPFALIEFHLELNQKKMLPKSSSYYNLAELIDKSAIRKPVETIFEKTPEWRNSYERTGNLIDVLKKYYQTVKSSPKFKETNQIIKRSKTVSLSNELKLMKTTKSMSCLNESYSTEYKSKRDKHNDETSKLKRRRSSSLTSDRSSNDESGYFQAKRRLNVDSSLDDLEFSTDYSYYSSFSSVFESSSSHESDFSHCVVDKNENEDDLKLDENESSQGLNEEDIVYLNDCSGEIFSSQSDNQEDVNQVHSSIKLENNEKVEQYHDQGILQQQQEEQQQQPQTNYSYLLTQSFNTSIPPPPLPSPAALYSYYQPKLYYPFAYNPYLYYQNYYNYCNNYHPSQQ